MSLILDLFLLLLLLAASIYGLWRGFVRIAIGVGGLALTLALALRLAERGPAWFPDIFKSEHVARLVAFVVVCACGLALTALIAWLAFRLVQAAQIGWIDRLVGGAIGFGGGLLLIAGLLVGLFTFLPAGSPMLKQSRGAKLVMQAVDAASYILPPRMAEAYKERREALAARGAGTHS